MLPRPRTSSVSILLLCALTSVLPPPLHGQSASSDQNGRPVFKANARTVVLDVVVAGKNGRPVVGLHKQDFLAAEDGNPQTVTFFEEHTGAQSIQADLPTLPPNVFTNIPRMKPGGAATVLLLDNLNTQLQDQSGVRARMLSYLKGVQPRSRFAIFALGTHLRYVQGFTDDPALLAAALKDPKRGAASEQPPLPLRSFWTEQELSQLDLRVRLTLQAFEELARYLAGIPGRKNVVWFSGSFPMVVMHKQGLPLRDYGEEVKKTDAVLSEAEVVLYPIASESLAADPLYDAGNQLDVTNQHQAQDAATGELWEDAKQRNANHTTMDEIARDTGGVAIYNTNGFNDALARVADQGSYYYTLAYTPTNTASDGQFRKIQVKLATGNYKLAYRRGYYAADAKLVQASVDMQPSDPLRTYMDPGTPDSTQIPLALRIQPESPKSGVSSSTPAPNRAGDNDNLRDPLRRYSVDFVVAARGLQFDTTPDGGRHGKIEAAMVVYDQQGRPLNWMVKQVNLDMDAARYAEVQQNGVNFTLEIDVPKDGVSLRSGVYDRESNLAGTLEVPLSAVVNTTQTASSK